MCQLRGEGHTHRKQHNQVQRSQGGTQSPEVFGGDVAAAIPDWRRPTGVGSKDAHQTQRVNQNKGDGPAFSKLFGGGWANR